MPRALGAKLKRRRMFAAVSRGRPHQAWRLTASSAIKRVAGDKLVRVGGGQEAQESINGNRGAKRGARA